MRRPARSTSRVSWCCGRPATTRARRQALRSSRAPSTARARRPRSPRPTVWARSCCASGRTTGIATKSIRPARRPLGDGEMIERMFKLSAQGTSVRTEVVAGFTTFLTMAYIVIVNPTILGQAGMPIAAVAAATCLAAGFGSILMGLIAHYPIALAPGMGLNAYFTFTVVKGMGLPWETALGCVFLSGVAFLVLTVAGIRQLIVGAIPRPLFSAVAAGVGLFIAFIGLKEAGVIVADPATTVALGDLTKPNAALAILGLLVMG